MGRSKPAFEVNGHEHGKARYVLDQEVKLLFLASIILVVVCAIWERRYRRPKRESSSLLDQRALTNGAFLEDVVDYTKRARACHNHTWSWLLGHISLSHGRRFLNRLPPASPLDDGHQMLQAKVEREGKRMGLKTKERALAVNIDAYTALELTEFKLFASTRYSASMGVFPAYLLALGRGSPGGSTVGAVLDINVKLMAAYNDVLKEMGTVTYGLCATVLYRLLQLHDELGAEFFFYNMNDTATGGVVGFDDVGEAHLRHFFENGALLLWRSPPVMHVVLNTLADDAIPTRDKLFRMMWVFSAAISAAGRLQAKFPLETSGMPPVKVIDLATCILADEAALAEAAPMPCADFCRASKAKLEVALEAEKENNKMHLFRAVEVSRRPAEVERALSPFRA